MRIVCLIDHFGHGGAQREITSLASLLKRRGEDVSFLTYYPLTYYPYDWYLPIVQDAGIQYRCIEDKIPFRRIRRIAAFRKVLRSGDQDVVLAFLQTPSLLAELAAFPYRRWGLVVTELNSYIDQTAGTIIRKSLSHVIADYVTTNSHTNRLLLERHCPWLRGRITTIYSAHDLEKYSPDHNHAAAAPEDEIRLMAAGRLEPQKNTLGLIDAMAKVKSLCPELKIRVDWFGAKLQPELYDDIQERVASRCVQEYFTFHDPTTEIAREYHRSSAFILPSFFEGVPNVVGEAMACGRPILASNVCDNSALVSPGENGLLFDPHSTDDMARVIIKFAQMPEEERRCMGTKSRQRAEVLFQSDPFVEKFIRLLTTAAKREKINLEHQPAEVPTSALLSMQKHLDEQKGLRRFLGD
jgi:glycosyltransferase involved in cell wall biosynthesis